MSEIPYYDFDPNKLPPKLLAAIGLVLASSAQTESIVESAIAGCSGLDAEYGFAITTHMAIPLKFSALKSVAEIRLDDLDALDRLDELITQCGIAFDRRNTIAHRQWCHDPKTGALFTLRQQAKERLELGVQPIKVEEVLAVAAFVYKTGMELMTFLMDTGLLPPLPPAGRNRSHKSKAERKKRRESKLG